MTPPVIETPRLRLRPHTLADLEASVAMDLDPAVRRYIGGPPDPDEIRARTEARIRDGWPEPGGTWAVEWRAEPGFLGWCGLFPLEDTGLIEIGYRYAQAAWGQGVATEAARTVLDHGFRVFNFDPIVAVAHPDNGASRRILSKLGLRHAGPAHHYDATAAFYRLPRADYLESTPAAQDS